METFSALLAICAGNSPVPGEFPAQRPVTRIFDICFDLRPSKRLSKQWWGSFIDNDFQSRRILLIFYTEHGSITAVLCVKYQNDTSTEEVVIDKRDFARLECKTGFVVTSH